MNRLAAVAALPVLAALTGCAVAQSAPPVVGDASGDRNVCQNDRLGQFVGRPATAELGAEIMRVSGARNLQWIAAGTMVTMDFRQDRVRVSLDEQNKVQRVSCG